MLLALINGQQCSLELSTETGYQLRLEVLVRNMAPSSSTKLLLLLIVHFFSNAVVANNDDVKSKLDALVQSLDRLSTVIDTKCKIRVIK